MEQLREYLGHGPTAFDSYANFGGELPGGEWLILLGRNRDSDCLTESNWHCALAELGGEENPDVQIDRFGHWACGWWESLSVRAGTKTAEIAQDIEASLADYPVLNDEDFSAREYEAANQVWADCYGWEERIAYIRKNRSQFEFHDFSDLLQCVRGEYFAGYAGELLY